MKIKNDFVTNSSSASFIMILKPRESMNLSEFTDKFGIYMSNLIKWNDNVRTNIRYWNGSMIKQNRDVFELEDHTSMYNDIYDIPAYMRHILIETQAEGELLWFTLEKFTIDED